MPTDPLFPFLSAATLVLLACPACVVVQDPGAGAASGGLGPGSTYDDDLREYTDLARRLDEHRTEFLGEKADEIRGVGPRLYWLDFTSFDPTLHSESIATGERVDYGFSIGAGDAYEFEASPELVATAEREGEQVVFRAYAAGAAASLLGELSVDAPTDEQRWWAYAVDAGTVYWVTTGSTTVLHRWVPGQSPEEVLALEDTGAEIGIFEAFGVEGTRMMFQESGRAWQLDLTAKQSVWLGAETEVSGRVSFDADGAFVPTADTPFYYDFASGTLRDIATEIAASPFLINESFATAHHYESDGTLVGRSVYYVGASGVFAYQLDSRDVRPLLLEPLADSSQPAWAGDHLRIEYRYPTLVDSGDLFVVGLTSTSGSVGADGPVYRVTGATSAP